MSDFFDLIEGHVHTCPRAKREKMTFNLSSLPTSYNIFPKLILGGFMQEQAVAI